MSVFVNAFMSESLLAGAGERRFSIFDLQFVMKFLLCKLFHPCSYGPKTAP